MITLSWLSFSVWCFHMSCWSCIFFQDYLSLTNGWDFGFSLFCRTYWTECLVPSICVRTTFPLIIVKTDVNEFMNKSSQGCKCWQVKICNEIWWSNTYFESKYTWSAVNQWNGNVHIYLGSSPALKFTTNLELSSRERLQDLWYNLT